MPIGGSHSNADCLLTPPRLARHSLCASMRASEGRSMRTSPSIVPRADQDLRQRHRRACHIPADRYDVALRRHSCTVLSQSSKSTPSGNSLKLPCEDERIPRRLRRLACHVSSLRLVGLLPAGLSTRLSTSEGKRRDRNAIIVASLLRRGQTLCVARLPTCAVAKIAPV